jgi:hypothetical protein
MTVVACIELPEIDANYTMNMPGIGELTFIRDSLADMPRPSDLLLRIMNILSPAMSPVYTLIRVLDVIIAITDCVKAIPKSLPFNPQPLIECFTNLFEAIAALVALLPPFAYIRLVVDIISLTRSLIDDILSIIVSIDREITRIKSTISRALADNDAVLLQIGNCAKDNLQQTTNSFFQVLEALTKIVRVVMNILEIIASTIPGPIGDQISDWTSSLDQIEASAASQTRVTDYPPLQIFVDQLVWQRNILVAIESAGKAILGLDFTSPALIEIDLDNP